MARKSSCKQCGVVFSPHGKNPGIYCTRSCKSAWQRTQKPVDRDWLYQKYIVEGVDANAIGRLVNRNGKRVWEWLRDLGIATRPRGGNSATWKKPGEPSSFKGRKHKPETIARLREIAIADGRVPYDPAVGSYMKGRRGADVPNWKGGITKDRQAFYSTPEWKAASKAVWTRDNAMCQRCGLKSVKGKRFAFDIHHIVSFEYRPLRAEPSNLVLLCERCHYWVHGKDNEGKLFIQETPCC